MTKGWKVHFQTTATQKHWTQHDGECVASLCGCCGARAWWQILGDSHASPQAPSQPALPPKISAINFNSCSFSPPACSWADHLSSRQLSQDILVMLIVGSRSSTIIPTRIALEGTKRKRRNGTKWHKMVQNAQNSNFLGAWNLLAPTVHLPGWGNSEEWVGKVNSAFSDGEGWFSRALKIKIIVTFFLRLF